jgi:metallo-beta-lactamase class B
MKWLLSASLCLLASSTSLGADRKLTLSHLRGNVYVVEDSFYSIENSVVYVGDKYVTVVGATWTPETAKLLADEVGKITQKPIKEVVDTNYHPDRAGGNSYFRAIGARIVSTKMTYDLMGQQWESIVRYMQKSMPDYPALPLVLPDTTYDGSFELQGGRVKGIYLGPSHTQDGIFVFFPEEKVLYGGCILKEKLGNLDFANLAEYPKTLRKLQQLHLGFTTIVAGHWSPIHGPELIDQYIQLLEQHAASR